MMDVSDGSKFAGTFLSGNRQLFGELTFQRGASNLHVRSDVNFQPNQNSNRCVQGTLLDLTNVSLLNCNASPVPSFNLNGSGISYYDNIFPHYIVYGLKHIEPTEAIIYAVSFQVDDGHKVFHQFGAFDTIFDPSSTLENAIKEYSRFPLETKNSSTKPLVSYFSGKHEIFRCETVCGVVSGRRRITTHSSRLDGTHIDSSVIIEVCFLQPVVFNIALESLVLVREFIDLVAGRLQNVSDIELTISRQEPPAKLQVYWSLQSERDSSSAKKGADKFDLLLNIHTETEPFETVMAQWISRSSEWRDARSRFFSGFRQTNNYGVDRLVAAANMFDILPSSALPKAPLICDEISSARDKARKIFKALPDGDTRTAILGALGRIGTNSLRQKITFRAQSLLEDNSECFPNLTKVIGHAVNCRNHFVHGSEPRIDYSKHFLATVPFLTDTLEFIFAASDLLDAGWDMSPWIKRGLLRTHPLGAFVFSYKSKCTELLELLPNNSTS